MPSKDTVLVKLSPTDNVVVALDDIERGLTKKIAGEIITITNRLSMGQKVACQDIAMGEAVLKYGLPIGVAKVDILKGEHVHIHNLESNYTKTHSLSETQSGKKGSNL